MRRRGPTTLDLAQPRTVLEVLATSLRLYGRYPVLFLLLALLVVAPYDLIVLAVTHTAPLGQQKGAASTILILTLVEFALVGPFVSALQVQALVTLSQGEQPDLLDLIRRGVMVLPVVAAAEIIAGIGIGLGLILFVIPGVFLALRWAVVAQVAAIERTDWPGALRRSAQLARLNYLRIFVVLFIVSVINLALIDAGASLAGTTRHAPEVILGIAVTTITRSFEALALAVLYFDLRARETARPPEPGRMA